MYLNFIFFVLLIILLFSGFIVLRSFYVRRRGVCSSDLFVHSDRIEICSWVRGRNDFYFNRVDKEHANLASHFVDERQSEQKFSFPKKIRIATKNRVFTVEFSTLGWNFVGEAPNSRRLKDGIELVAYVEQLLEHKCGHDITIMFKPLRQRLVAVIGLLIVLLFLLKPPVEFHQSETKETLADIYKYRMKQSEHPLNAFRPRESEFSKIERASNRLKTFYNQGQLYKKLYCYSGMLAEVEGLSLQLSHAGLKTKKDGKQYVDLILAYDDPKISYLYNLPVGKIEFEVKTGITSQLFELFVVDADSELAIVEVLFDKKNNSNE